MSLFVGPAVNGALGVVHTSQKNPLGLIVRTDDGGEAIYLKGVASLAVGDWVSIDKDFGTARLVQGAIGPIAVASAAVTASTSFGWFVITSPAAGYSGAANAAISSNSKVYIDSTTGALHSGSHANDWVANCFSRSVAAAALATFEFARPFVSNGGYLV